MHVHINKQSLHRNVALQNDDTFMNDDAHKNDDSFENDFAQKMMILSNVKHIQHLDTLTLPLLGCTCNVHSNP